MERGSLIAGRYELTELLGRGGMGEVWACRDHELHRNVAVKLLHRDDNASPELIQRFKREAVAAAQINHPNIVALHDRGTHGQLQFLVMEQVEGTSLTQYLHRQGPLSLDHALEIAQEICAALAAAHEANVVHYDIKPSNIMLTANGSIKVVDFGIAGFTHTHTFTVAPTTALSPAGTAQYGAPEQFQDQRGDERSDLYALGSVLFALLTGEPPFADGTPLSVIRCKLDEEPRQVDELRPDVPAPVVQLLADLLRRDPEDRPRTATAVQQRLTHLRTDMSGRPSPLRAGSPEVADRPASDLAQRPARAKQVEDGPADTARQGRNPIFTPTTPAHHEPSPPPGYVPTLQEAGGDPVREPFDPVRVALEQRLDRVLAHYVSDEAEFARMLDLLIHDLGEALGADDPLSVEAGYQRAMYFLQSAHDQRGLENMLPRLLRVLGPEHRRTVGVRAILTGNTAARGHVDGRRYVPELREIIALATRVVGARDPITLIARLDLAEALDREYDAFGQPLPRNGPRDDAQAARRRALLEPLLPDLEQGLGDEDSRVIQVKLRLALDTYQGGDYRAALPLYEQLLPTSPAALARSDVHLRIQHAHCVSEAGDPERALSLLETLLKTLRNKPGNEYQQHAAPAITLRAALKKQIRQNRRANNRPRFRL